MAQQLGHLAPDPAVIAAQGGQDLGCYAVALADQAEQDVLGPDVVVAELQRLAQGELQDLLGPRGERDVPGRGLAAAAHDADDPLPHRLLVDAQRGRARAATPLPSWISPSRMCSVPM